MALVDVGFSGFANLLDQEGSKSTLEYQLTAADVTTALADMTTIIGRLNAVTDAVVSGYGVRQAFAENALVLPAGAEVEKRAVISAIIAGTAPTKYANIMIPAPSQGVMVSATGPGARVVDVNDADMIAYLSSFEAGGLATVSDGEVIADSASSGNWYGKKVHRGSRRG
jgi:hypothetical protein